MRIVGGELKGRRIAAPHGQSTRPTTDRVREALMSVLSSRMGGFGDAVVLDAFAGSGALGLEALSRGATRAVFVERARPAQSAIRANISALGLEARARLIAADASTLAKRGVPGGPFTLILLDPPYTLDQTEIMRFLEHLAANGGMEDGATVMLERSGGKVFPWSQGFSDVVTKRYGSTEIDVATFDEEGWGSR